MSKTIRVSATDLDRAKIFLEENFETGNKEKQMTTLLICEELITRLLQSGNDEVSLSIRRVFTPHIEIVSDLPLDDHFDHRNSSDEERIESEIRRDILNQYGAYIDQEKNGSRVCYKVYSSKRSGEAVKEDIFKFYSQDRRNGK